MRVDHIAIAVKNVEEALKNYQKILNVDELEIEEVPNEKVKVAMLMLQDTRIELMEPTSPDSPISKFLEERGEGIHHIAITADDIEKDVARASANGMRMLGGLRRGDLAAIRHNVRLLRATTGGQLIAIVKAAGARHKKKPIFACSLLLGLYT